MKVYTKEKINKMAKMINIISWIAIVISLFAILIKLLT